jgi:hypothetical protein
VSQNPRLQRARQEKSEKRGLAAIVAPLAKKTSWAHQELGIFRRDKCPLPREGITRTTKRSMKQNPNNSPSFRRDKRPRTEPSNDASPVMDGRTQAREAAVVYARCWFLQCAAPPARLDEHEEERRWRVVHIVTKFTDDAAELRSNPVKSSAPRTSLHIEYNRIRERPVGRVGPSSNLYQGEGDGVGPSWHSA